MAHQDTLSCVSGQERHVAHKCVKTQCCVSAAKKDVRHTSVLFTGTAKYPFSTPHISITTGPIFITFTYFIPSIYTTLHTKFSDKYSSLWDMHFWKLPNFLHIFFFFTTIYNNSNFEPRETTFSKMDFFQIWYTNKAHSSLYSPKIWRCYSSIL